MTVGEVWDRDRHELVLSFGVSCLLCNGKPEWVNGMEYAGSEHLAVLYCPACGSEWSYKGFLTLEKRGGFPRKGGDLDRSR